MKDESNESDFVDPLIQNLQALIGPFQVGVLAFMNGLHNQITELLSPGTLRPVTLRPVISLS